MSYTLEKLEKSQIKFQFDVDSATFADAIKEAYRLSDGVKFEGAYRRSDIGQRALQALK